MSVFFAPHGKYSACGTFGAEHLILLVLSIILLTVLFYLSRNFDRKSIRRSIICCSVILWTLEIIKIIFNITKNGLNSPNNYIPLYFCSLTLYCAPMSAFGKNKIKRAGEVFMAVGAPVGGLVFLMFPNTSLSMYPMFHFISIQSFIYHTLMIYMGILILTKKYVVLNLKDLLPYAAVISVCGGIAYIINAVLDTNLMFISKNFPGTLIETAYKLSGPVFPITILLSHIIFPFFIVYIISNHYYTKSGQKSRNNDEAVYRNNI